MQFRAQSGLFQIREGDLNDPETTNAHMKCARNAVSRHQPD
jgi:hypothetical protein